MSVPIRNHRADGVETFTILPPQDMQIGILSFRQISFVTLADTGKDVPKVGFDGLLPASLFRRIYIGYADRFVILEPWLGKNPQVVGVSQLLQNHIPTN